MRESSLRSILLLGTQNSVALPLVRSLAMALPQAYIHAVSKDDKHPQITNFSKYITSHSYINTDNREIFIDELIAVIKAKNVDILLPVDEYFSKMVVSLQEQLKTYTILPSLPDTNLLERLIHKDRLSSLLTEIDLPSTEIYDIKTLDPEALDPNTFPYVLKPIFGSSGLGIKRVDTKAFLIEEKKNEIADEYILQEYIPGYDIDCSLLAVDGVIKAYTIQRGIESNGFTFPTAIYFTQNQALYDLVERFIVETKYNGIAHLDFRFDERDGQFKLIDFNARYWFSLLGSTSAGINFPLLHCLAAMGIPFERPAFEECIYLMGKKALSFNRKKYWPKSSKQVSIYSDFFARLKDPLPELLRLVR
ncbi:MAG: hypothetical protein U5K71_08285 [Gracilimonas sp.]|nr:hypothetical protein [Gracilimonas sp.]